MCGIAGTFSLEITDKQIVQVHHMCEQIIHRGRDDFGTWSDDKVCLGHRRLSILDLSVNGKQPMTTHDARYQIVFNGELYNFKSLRKELQTHHRIAFQSTSDTEVVLYAYVIWGKKCLDKFDGMFAVAIWDTQAKKMFLARDLFGEKPLYYTFLNDQFYFASEPSAIAKVLPQKPDINYEGLNQFLALGYILTPHTIYEQIYQLPSAHFMEVWDNGHKHTIRKYWNYGDAFRQPKTQESEAEVCEHLTHLVRESVKSRMVSDVPVGAFLSGGVDSSAIVAFMKELQGGPLHTFSAGFAQEGYNELPDAQKVAQYFQTIHHSHILAPQTATSIENTLKAYTQPLADNALIPLVELAQNVLQEGVKVVLSGDGADEIFMGYVTYDTDRYYKYTHILPHFVRSMSGQRQEIQPSNQKFTWSYKIPQFFYATLGNFQQAHYSWRLIFRPEERIEVMGEAYREFVYDTDPWSKFKQHYQEVSDLTQPEQHLYVDAMTWLTDDILIETDRATMWAGIEGRCPFLNKNLVNYVATIPINLKIKRGKKYIFKKSLEKILPDYVLCKKKSGFNAPVNQWLTPNKMTNEF